MNSFDLEFGVVHFDDTFEHSSGYYVKAGDKAKRLSSNKCGDLATNVVWMTNLGYDVMRSAHMYPHARYRRNDFLGENVKTLLGRIGFFDLSDPVTCQEGIEHLAIIFSRVMQYADTYGGFESVPMYNLRTGFRERFNRPDPQVSMDLKKIMEESEAYFISVERPVTTHQPVWLPLYLPPWDHCMSILSQPLPGPKAEWKQISPKNLPKNNEEIANWNPGMGVAKVALINFMPEFSEMINFGSNPTRRHRRWVTFEELRFLAEVCEAKVEAAWTVSKTQVPLEYREIAEKIPEKHRYSISGMIFLHNLWSAPAQNYTAGLRAQMKNLSSPFIRCYDRVMCLNAAMKAKQEGLEVVGYSSCKVYINCVETSAAKVLSVCKKLGFIPPLCSVDESDDTNTDMSQLLSLHQTLWGRGNLHLLMEYDKKCYEEIIR